jgi:hypothetical protein
MTCKNGYFFCNYHNPHSQVSQNSDVYDLNDEMIIFNINLPFVIFRSRPSKNSKADVHQLSVAIQTDGSHFWFRVESEYTFSLSVF